MQKQVVSPEFFRNKLMCRRFHTMCYVTLESSLKSHSNCEHGCAMNKQSAILLSLWTEGSKEIVFHRLLSAHFWDDVLPLRSGYEWTKMFKNGRRSESDADCAGWRRA